MGKQLFFLRHQDQVKPLLSGIFSKPAIILIFSISATTRPRRADREIDGKDYYFLSLADFKQKIAKKELVEWEEVYNGNFYGTLKSEINRLWSTGKHVVFDVDVQGGLKLKQHFKEKSLAIFVRVKNVNVLEKRLRHRNTESEMNIKKRLAKAEHEMTFENGFDHILVSDKLEQTLNTAEKLVFDFVYANNC